MNNPSTPTTSAKKKVHFVSLGCPKNLVDTEMMLGSLVKDGYEITDQADGADTVIVNTCSFIEDSRQESISKILELSELKTAGGLENLVVAGCLTQRYKDDLVEGLPEADLFVGSGEFQNIAGLLREKTGEKAHYHLPTFLQEDDTPRINTQPRHRAYLKISEGCKKRCAFCAIPHIRGNLQSRQVASVVSEAKLLVAGGVKELIVISHDFTDYGWDLRRKDPEVTADSYELLKALAEESGAQLIRVLYLYPDGVDQKLIDLMKSHKNLVPYFDMPLQHINDDVLKRMNRRMKKQQIVDAVELIRKEIPDAVIRTQFIVGFPGETEDEFQELMEFIEEYRFERVGCFKYSIEENTKAGTMDDQIDEDTKERRYDAVMSLQQEISREKHEAMIGRQIEVVVEGYSEETELLLVGRTSQQAPEIDGVIYINDGEASVGDIVMVEITDAHDYDLVGHILSE